MILRWTCEKCNKKWIYPIEKCIYCKGNITKQKGTALKIIGTTKVNIPSVMHPIIPYNVILLEDEFGSRQPKKTMKEYKIGDTYVEQKAKNDNAVSVVKVKYDIYEAIIESLSLVKDFNLNPEDKILIKASCSYPAYPYQAVNNNPEFIDALIKVLINLGIKKDHILVAEQGLIGIDVMDAAAKSGILEACKKNGVKFADISKGPFEEIEHEGFKFNIFKEAITRKTLNAPVMKTNSQLGISGALENLTRLCDEATQRIMFYEGIDNTLPKLSKEVKCFTIADATNGMQDQGPLSGGEPAFLNLVYSSDDAASIDAVFCDATMIGIPACVKNSMASPFDEIEIVGNELDAFKYPIKHARQNETPHPDIKMINGKACPACINSMQSLTSKLLGMRGHQITLIIGSQFSANDLKENERLVALGDCAIKKLQELQITGIAKLDEKTDDVEKIVLLQKLLTTEGTPKITQVDKVKSKMKKLLSKVAG